MKKIFFNPEMNIRDFMKENVVTASGTEAQSATADDFNNITADNQRTVSWNKFGIVF